MKFVRFIIFLIVVLLIFALILKVTGRLVWCPKGQLPAGGGECKDKNLIVLPWD